ncbi:MAG: class I SAM-dependent methyltransferase [Candidatus Methanoperedens sp.]|nr:class I SAM-dependent methyltransferase [Candidatus Methanoperedens sp.]
MDIKKILPKTIYSDVPDYYLQVSDVERRLVGKDLKGKTILNIGCGGYIVSDVYFTLLGAKVVGIDYDRNAIERAHNKIKNLKNIDIEVKYGDGRKLDFPDNSFDFTVSFSAIEHMPLYEDRLLVIKEMKRVTKKNGFVIIIGPNFLNLPTTLFSHLFFKRIHEYEHRYVPWELKEMMVKNGLEVVSYDAESVYLVDKALIETRFPWLKTIPLFFFYPLHILLKFLNAKPFKIFGMRMGFKAKKV